MPLYDYVCRACGKEFELLVLGGETPACPACQSKDLAKQMSVCAHRSKGGSTAGGSSGAGSGCAGCSSSNCSSCH
ncbi:MAG: FmdB family transcriptional regulator [Deltaproteobacteria bacterium RIFOXYD12_FULL_57_12]|nr:MAG: FmdB family transcriptional regulator [Deltaproteobacteria bacterium RIFOXYD12_FULL_57_12]